MGASFVLAPGTGGSVVTGLYTTPFFTGISDGVHKISPLSDGSLPVTIVTSSGEPTINNKSGTSSIASGANANVISYVTAAINYVSGIQICSTQDGLWTFTLPGFATLYFVTTQVSPNYSVMFPIPVPVASSQSIVLNAQNITSSGSAATGTYSGGWYAHL